MKAVFAAVLAAVMLAACENKPKTEDPYGSPELKSPPAKLSSERHTGAFAEGSALSTVPELKPLDPQPVKTIRLDTTHKIIEIAPGV
ncbi:MAG TPA: cytochrome C, partial [Burkholderiales bacterium]